MEAPVSKQENLEEIFLFESVMSGKKFKVTITKQGRQSILIQALSNDSSFPERYEAKRSLSKMQSLGRSFKFCENIDEILEVLKNAVDNNDIGIISSENQGEMNLEIKAILPTGKIEEIKLKLIKFDKDSDSGDLDKEVESLKNDVTTLEEKVDRLEEENKTLKDSIEKLSAQVNQIIREKHDKKKLKKEKELVRLDKQTSLITQIDEEKLIGKSLSETAMFKNIPFEELKFEQIYSTTKDDWSDEGFHKKCDDANNTLVIIKTTEGTVFGGFTTKTWNKSNGEIRDDDNAFVFSFSTMKSYKIINGKNCIRTDFPGPRFLSHSAYMINFSHDLKSGNTTTSKESFYSGMTKDYELNNGRCDFTVQQIDVLKISF